MANFLDGVDLNYVGFFAPDSIHLIFWNTQGKRTIKNWAYFYNLKIVVAHSGMGKDMTFKISNTNKISIFDTSKV